MESKLKSAAEGPVGRKKEEEETRLETEINVHVSDPQDPDYPETHRINSPNEVHLLNIADNFQEEFSLLHPDRRPLLLCPVNECGVRKFVSTTLRPKSTPYPELALWDRCASFVADFLSLNPLEPPDALPRQMLSSMSVLLSQKANCFESASLLCSLLLGINYDAYCVSGYAVKEMCLLDQSSLQCPLLDTKVKTESPKQEEKENKYKVKPPRVLKSLFLEEQEKKKQEPEAAVLQKQKQLEGDEQKPVDPLHGLRVHCWVLVLSGCQNVWETFFIDPLSGKSYPTDSDNFLGIESVWNNFNYYVNLQDCKNGCAGMMFDLDNLKKWRPVLPGVISKRQRMFFALMKRDKRDISIPVEEEQLRAFEMPRSWVSNISISKKDVETRWPGGQKVTQYKKAKLERFAVGLNPNGLVRRLTTYKDVGCTEVAVVKEWYEHRRDELEEREFNKLEDFTSERFKFRGCFHLSFHRWASLTTGTEREMHFFSRTHLENVVRRVLVGNEMKEFFEGRSDFLHYRHVVFTEAVESLGRIYPFFGLENMPLSTVVERFHRNKSIPANEDVAERVFMLPEREIELTYHLMDRHFIPSKRFFKKPKYQFEEDMVSTFQIDQSAKPLPTRALKRILGKLVTEETELSVQISNSLREVKDILACREQEENIIELLSPNQAAAWLYESAREQEGRAAEEEKFQRETLNNTQDILQKFVIKLSKVDNLSAEEAKRFYNSFLSDFKFLMEQELRNLETFYKKNEKDLEEKQSWYCQNHPSITKELVELYQGFCSTRATRMSHIQVRINRCKETADQKYKLLEQSLRHIPKLAPHLQR